MAEAMRITPEETFQKLRAGKALLVCGYDSKEKFMVSISQPRKMANG